MTAAAANRNGEYTVNGPFEHYAVAGSKHIFAYTLVGFTAAGYIEPYSTSTSVKFAGVAVEECDNSAGSSGDKVCRVALGGKFKLEKSGTITIANIGEPLNAIDDQTASLAVAVLSTALTGAQNDILWTSQLKGEEGKRITIEYVDPGGASAALSVDVQGYGIKILLATGTDSAITSTADLIKAAVAALPAAAALVVGTDVAANDGTGIVTAMAETNLAYAGPVIGPLAEIDGSDIWARIDAAVAA